MRGKHSYVSIFIYSFNQCLHHGFIQAKNLEKGLAFTLNIKFNFP